MASHRPRCFTLDINFVRFRHKLMPHRNTFVNYTNKTSPPQKYDGIRIVAWTRRDLVRVIIIINHYDTECRYSNRRADLTLQASETTRYAPIVRHGTIQKKQNTRQTLTRNDEVMVLADAVEFHPTMMDRPGRRHAYSNSPEI